jgi:hypothetical protein
MTETQKKELWQIAEVFRGTKGSGNINDIARVILKEQLKDKIKPEYQNTEFVKNINFKWQSTAPDNSVEYVDGSFQIEKEALLESENLMSISMDLRKNSYITYGDGRSIFLDTNSFPFAVDSTTSIICESRGGIRYFRDGALNPLQLVEQHIENYFSVARLLQMKVWWDAIPHENTPKLAAVYQWTGDSTNAAIGGATTFSEPPFTFEEIAQEIASLS